jgi:hypothetical protein
MIDDFDGFNNSSSDEESIENIDFNIGEQAYSSENP